MAVAEPLALFPPALFPPLAEPLERPQVETPVERPRGHQHRRPQDLARQGIDLARLVVHPEDGVAGPEEQVFRDRGVRDRLQVVPDLRRQGGGHLLRDGALHQAGELGEGFDGVAVRFDHGQACAPAIGSRSMSRMMSTSSEGVRMCFFSSRVRGLLSKTLSFSGRWTG